MVDKDEVGRLDNEGVGVGVGDDAECKRWKNADIARGIMPTSHTVGSSIN
jgi:hypothetical protein